MEEKKHTDEYSINYKDGSYRIVEWHIDDFMEIAGKITTKEHAVIIDGCLYVLDEIRAIIKLPPQPEEIEEDKSDEPDDEIDLGEYDFLDFEARKWLANVAKLDTDKGGRLDD